MYLLDIKDRFLAIYPLSAGLQATNAYRIANAKMQLRAAIAAGDANMVARVTARLGECGMTLGAWSHVLIALAKLPVGRRYSGSVITSAFRLGKLVAGFGSVLAR